MPSINNVNGSRTVEAMLKEARQARTEDIALADAMQRLIQNNDFCIYQQLVIQKRVEEFGARLLEPAGTMDGLVNMEFLKGAMYAFCLVRDLPSVIIQAIGEVRPKEELDNADEDEFVRKANDMLRAP